MWIDSHCHLDDERLKPDISQVVARAHAAGVEKLVSISTRMKTSQALIDLVAPFENVFCTVGTHPHQAGEEPDVSAQQIIDMTYHPKVVGIGEAGLDYFYDNAPPEIQEKVFVAHIEAARKTGLPLVIHARAADEHMIQILTRETGKGAFPALLHCFSSGQKLADCGVELGLFFSLSGICTFPKSNELRDIVTKLPHDRIIVETDAPYLAPVPHRGKLNEPSFVVHTGAFMALYYGKTVEEFAAMTTQNFYRLFNKVPSGSSGQARG